MAEYQILKGLDSKATTEDITATDKTFEGQTKRGINVVGIYSIGAAHSQVHNGNFWSVGKIFASLADSTTAEILVRNGSSKSLHMAMGFNGAGGFHVFGYEGATTSSDGTAINATSNNRVNVTASSATWTHTPSLVTTGSLLFEDFIPGGAKSAGSGGQDGSPTRFGSEWILATSTTYLFRILNQSGGINDYSIGFGYYEV